MPCKILVVEDSATQAEALRALLEEEEYDVEVARSGEAALERISGEAFDLIVSDIMMPGISGWQLCRRIKDDLEHRAPPVVLLTSLGDPMDIVRGLEAGADNYITKPYEPEHLLSRLRRVLDNRRLRASVRTSMGVNISFLGSTFTIGSDREQILDLLLSSVEDTVRTNRELQERQRELAEAHRRLEAHAQRVSEEARVSAEWYRALMQNAGDAIFVVDAAGQIVEANPRAGELLGRRHNDLLRRPLPDLVVPEEAEEVRGCFAHVSRAGQVKGAERRFVHADGRVVFCEVSASAASSDGQELMLVIARDVTERREAEETLRRSEETLRTVIEASPVAIVSLDQSGSVQTWNSAAERIFGWTASEVTGGPLPIVPADQQAEFRALFDRARGGEALTDVEVERQRQDGSRLWLSLSAAPQRDADGEISGCVALLADITEQKRAEEALRSSEEQLRQAQKMEAVGRLAGGIAHDFNNLLTTITGSAQLLLMDLPADDPMREEIEEIDQATTRAASLTRQLLTFSRQQVLQPEILDLNSAVSHAEKILRRTLGEDIEFVTVLAPEVGSVKMDRGQLEQILMNLAINARDAMPEGGRLILGTESMESSAAIAGSSPDEMRPGTYVVLSVSDTGTGIPREARERIFEPFYTTKPQGKGTGLGLSTVYGIVKQTEGYIHVDSEEGRGTTFTIYLPEAEAELAAAEPGHSPGPVPERSGTVLVVEDEPSVRKNARRVLERAGFQVLEAGGGEEALRVSADHEAGIDLLLTDVVMPGMSGRELAERLNGSRPEMRVLFTSGYTDEAISQHGVLDDGIAFLQKPYGLEALVGKVAEVLETAEGGA